MELMHCMTNTDGSVRMVWKLEGDAPFDAETLREAHDAHAVVSSVVRRDFHVLVLQV